VGVDTLSPVRRLIINADDFGLTAGVNRAIAELNRSGALTSATLMASAEAGGEAVHLSPELPTLGVGCHVVLVDGDPILPASEIPSLVDAKTGRLWPTLGAFLPRLLSGRIRAEEIEAEAFAQISNLRTRGVALSHCDTHKHTHMFSAVLKPVLRAMNRAGVTAIRNPFEPVWSVDATPGAPWKRKMQVKVLRTMEPGFLRAVQAAGIQTTNGALGVLATGTLDARSVEAILKAMPEGCWELVTHPGYNDAALAQARTRLLQSREVEREALHVVRNLSGIELITFNELR